MENLLIILVALLYLIGFFFARYKIGMEEDEPWVEFLLFLLWTFVFFYVLVWTGLNGTFLEKWDDK